MVQTRNVKRTGNKTEFKSLIRFGDINIIF